MNYNELTSIVLSEKEALDKILEHLDEQYKMILKKDVFGLESMVDKLKQCNKDVARMELERRKFVGEGSMKDIVKKSKNNNLINAYKSINKLLFSIKQQKETNELLIKQQMSFNTQLINLINPRRDTNTYNSYGKLTR